MDNPSPAASLCIQGTQAEYQGRIEAARQLYWQAWEAARDDYEACIGAHYVAHLQERAQDQLLWNQEALARAEKVGDDRVRTFYPSLYLNLGRSHELLGNLVEAQKFYDLAAELGVKHQPE